VHLFVYYIIIKISHIIVLATIFLILPQQTALCGALSCDKWSQPCSVVQWCWTRASHHYTTDALVHITQNMAAH